RTVSLSHDWGFVAYRRDAHFCFPLPLGGGQQEKRSVALRGYTACDYFLMPPSIGGGGLMSPSIGSGGSSGSRGAGGGGMAMTRNESKKRSASRSENALGSRGAVSV